MPQQRLQGAVRAETERPNASSPTPMSARSPRALRALVAESKTEPDGLSSKRLAQSYLSSMYSMSTQRSADGGAANANAGHAEEKGGLAAEEPPSKDGPSGLSAKAETELRREEK